MDPNDPVEVDPKELLEMQEHEKEQAEELAEDRARLRLNTLVAITVALLATFLGICKIKDNNLVLAMEHSQATSIDGWNFYQAKNIREAVYQSAADGFAIQAASASAPDARVAYAKMATQYANWAKDQDAKKAEPQKQAQDADKSYEHNKQHHDIFDLEEALISVAVSLFAVTSLTQRRWLFGIALVPSVGGVILGLAGLFNAPIDVGVISKFFG
jgi:uncharacterized membrane protein